MNTMEAASIFQSFGESITSVKGQGEKLGENHHERLDP